MISIVPAVLLGLFTTPAATFKFFTTTDFSYELNFWEVFTDISFFNCVWWRILLKFAGIVIFTSIAVGVIDRDMKVGDFNLKKPLEFLNDNLLVVFPIVTIMFGVFVLGQFIISALIVLWQLILPGAFLWMSIATSALVYIVVLLLFAVSLAWAAEAIETGRSLGKALAEALRNVRGKTVSLLLGIMLPIPVLLAISHLTAFYNIEVAWLINIVVYLFVYTYFVSYAFTSYYELCGLEREDLNKINIWKRR